MLSHESSSNADSYDNGNALYLTNGRNLFLIRSAIENHGLAGGRYTTLEDCVNGETHVVDELDMLTLEKVTPTESGS